MSDLLKEWREAELAKATQGNKPEEATPVSKAEEKSTWGKIRDPLAAGSLRLGGPIAGQQLGAGFGAGFGGIGALVGIPVGGALGGGISEYLAEKQEGRPHVNPWEIAVAAGTGAIPGYATVRAGRTGLSALLSGAQGAGHNIASEVAKGAPLDRKSTRLNSSHIQKSRMPSSA